MPASSHCLKDKINVFTLGQSCWVEFGVMDTCTTSQGDNSKPNKANHIKCKSIQLLFLYNNLAKKEGKIWCDIK